MIPFQSLLEETRTERDRLFSLPILADLAEGRYGLASYQAFLINAYQHVRHTVPLMMACGSRLPERLAWLQPALLEYIREEAGHEQWILSDLAATGADPNLARRSAPSMETEVMVAYVYDYIERRNPIGFFGMVHVLEGTSTALATSAAKMIQDHLQLGDAATSYLRSHGDLDREHVAFFASLINQISNRNDLDDIIHVARLVFHLYGQVLESVPREVRKHVA